MCVLSVIICTMNRSRTLKDVLNCLTSQSMDKNLFEVLVLDQSTDEKTFELLKKYPDFKYQKLNSRGISISRNEGIKASRGDYLVFVDDDVTFENNYLQDILDFFNTSELKPDMVGGKINLVFEAQKPEWLQGHLLNALASADFAQEPSFYPSHPKHVPYTCNAAVKRDCALNVGGFVNYISEIESKFALNDDVLFANKVRNAGYRVVYNPTMVVDHHISPDRTTLAYFNQKYYAHGRSDAVAYYYLGLYFLKDTPSLLYKHFVRLIEGLLLFSFQKNSYDRQYQKLRIPYNYGYIKGLLKVVLNAKNIKKAD